MFIDKEGWKKRFKGWLITDIAVRDRNIIYLCARKALPDDEASRLFDHDIPVRLISVYLDETNPQLSHGCAEGTGYNKPRLGVSLLPKAQGLLVARNSDGQTIVVGSGKWPDENIHVNGWPLAWRVKCINGYAFTAGDGRKVYRRVEIGKWIKIDDGIPKVDATSAQGFSDIDAFSESDMYAVGGHGDVWHYDGNAWEQMGFPSNVQLATVTCAGDGNVYISGEGGSLWVGKKSTWKRVYEGGSSILWNDVLWFDNKLWLASDYQFRIWDGKEMQSVEHKGESVPAYGHMDARDGLLLIASPHAVWSFDGKEWKTIVAPYLD